MFDERRTVTLSQQQHPIIRRNRYGAIGFEGAGNTIRALVQGFSTGELWGANGEIIREHNLDGRLTIVIPSIALEKAFVKALANYVAVATGSLGLAPPFQVKMGVAGVENALLSAPGGPLGGGQYLGPIFQGEISHTAELHKIDDMLVRSILRDFFIKIWDAAASSRAEILTDEFVTAHDLPPR